MKVPNLLVSSAILLWGAQLGIFVPAIILAVVLELLTRLTNFELPEYAKFKIADGMYIAALIVLIFLFFTQGAPHATYGIFKWVPLVFTPLVFYNKSSIYTFGFFFRPALIKNKLGLKQIDANWILFGLYLIGATVGNTRHPMFYVGMVIICGWAMWAARPRSSYALAWGNLLLAASVFGYAGQIGLGYLQEEVVAFSQEWFMGDGDVDPYQSETAIGHIGEMKLSDKIILRVSMPKDVSAPLLIHEASYDYYSFDQWDSLSRGFTPVTKTTDWMLDKTYTGTNYKSITIIQSFKGKKGVLALPLGSVKIRGDFRAVGLEANGYGAVKAKTESSMDMYKVMFTGKEILESDPIGTDLKMSPTDLRVIKETGDALHLKEIPKNKVPETIRKYFQDNFTYSTYQGKHDSDVTPLTEFLTITKSGHCEYFATAATLLLRYAGIPARYSVGYSVNEYSDFEQMYVVRGSHGHAWTRYYLNGAWQELDSTPSSWMMMDNKKGNIFFDKISWLGLQISQWWANLDLIKALKSVFGVSILVLLVAGIWVYRKSPAFEHQKNKKKYSNALVFKIEKLLISKGYGRLDSETFDKWVARLHSQGVLGADINLSLLMMLFNKQQYKPAGLDVSETTELEKLLLEMEKNAKTL